MLAKYLASKQGCELTGFVEGDDGLFATAAELRIEDYAKLGFTIKIDEIDDPCTASFCGMVFADSGQIVRNPVDFLACFGWTGSFISGRRELMQSLLRAKALSTVYETPQCPIVGALARKALRDTRGSVPKFVQDGYHVFPKDEIPLPEFCPAEDTRQLVARLYGISVATQLLIEHMIDDGDLDHIVQLLPQDRVKPYLEYSSKYLEAA